MCFAFTGATLTCYLLLLASLPLVCLMLWEQCFMLAVCLRDGSLERLTLPGTAIRYSMCLLFWELLFIVLPLLSLWIFDERLLVGFSKKMSRVIFQFNVWFKVSWFWIVIFETETSAIAFAVDKCFPCMSRLCNIGILSLDSSVDQTSSSTITIQLRAYEELYYNNLRVKVGIYFVVL